MLLANLEIGLHEQTRLQPEIELTLAELVALVERFGGAVTDWSVLEQRMGYIVRLFRAFHDQPELSTPPFTPIQVERFLAGMIPDGAL
jgi:hypothetical protein